MRMISKAWIWKTGRFFVVSWNLQGPEGPLEISQGTPKYFYNNAKKFDQSQVSQTVHENREQIQLVCSIACTDLDSSGIKPVE